MKYRHTVAGLYSYLLITPLIGSILTGSLMIYVKICMKHEGVKNVDLIFSQTRTAVISFLLIPMFVFYIYLICSLLKNQSDDLHRKNDNAINVIGFGQSLYLMLLFIVNASASCFFVTQISQICLG